MFKYLLPALSFLLAFSDVSAANEHMKKASHKKSQKASSHAGNNNPHTKPHKN